MPILVLVLISIFEIGAAFRNYLTVSYLAREGARMSAFSKPEIAKATLKLFLPFCR
ncbi:hypothetical protein BH18ACT6_BH18ACT6_22870 [soil metagenome]